MTELIETFKQLMELGSPAIYLLILWNVWKEYRKTIATLIEYATKQNNETK